MTERDWTAKRNGVIYCAPACGGGCTWAAYQEATKNAAALAKKCSSGYTPYVHENLGWHFAAISPCRQIYVGDYGGKGDRYTALFGERDSHGGRWVGRGRTANAAIARAIQAARAEMDGIGAMLSGLTPRKGNK